MSGWRLVVAGIIGPIQLQFKLEMWMVFAFNQFHWRKWLLTSLCNENDIHRSGRFWVGILKGCYINFDWLIMLSKGSQTFWIQVPKNDITSFADRIFKTELHFRSIISGCKFSSEKLKGFVKRAMFICLTCKFTKLWWKHLNDRQLYSYISRHQSCHSFFQALKSVKRFSDYWLTNISSFFFKRSNIVALLCKQFATSLQLYVIPIFLCCVVGRNVIAIILSTATSYILLQNGLHPFSLTGYIPPGIPAFTPPPFSVMNPKTNRTYTVADISEVTKIVILVKFIVSFAWWCNRLLVV